MTGSRAVFVASGSRAGPTVLVTGVGAATGSRAAAAALACAASAPDRAALLIDLAGGRPSRPTPIATSAARELEERLLAHLPDASVASRGQICQLTLPAKPDGVARIPAALPLVRESAAVVHLPPRLLQPALVEPRIRPTAALLRADLATDRALTALAATDLLERDIRVAVLKRPLGWLAARAALLGIPTPASQALPARPRNRLLSAADNEFHRCYDRKDEPEGDRQETSGQEPQGPATGGSAPQGDR